MGGHLQLEMQEREQKQWEPVARAKGFFCRYCYAMLSKDEVAAFGDTCSKHQNGFDDKD